MTPEPAAAPLLGICLHTVGAASAALCYAPQRFVRRWSWQSYWLVQACGCWLVLPWLFAWLTVPDFGAVLAEAPRPAMVNAYLLGVLYGVGGIAFGVAIRYIGFSLTYAIAIGVSCVLGTLIPPLIAGTLAATLATRAGTIVVAGVILGAAAMVVTGLAGFRKERELSADAAASGFNARLGIPVCLLAGALSAVFNFSLQAAQPIADVAARHGAGNFQGNAMYIFSNGGAFTTTLVYVAVLATRGSTWAEFAGMGADGPIGGAVVARNYGLAAATGCLWYFQFFFYGLAHVRMGRLQFSSWAIHMIILILLSCGFGVVIGEWRACRPSTRLMILSAIVILLGSVGLISYGNFLAAPPAGTS